MDLRKLRHCVVVADLASFTRAAALLGVPQSVLSRHVRDVELTLGTALLRRTGRGAVLTDAGTHLLPKLRALVASGEAVLEDARNFADRPSGAIRLGVLSSLGATLLTPLLNRAFDALPGVQIHTLEALTDHLDELLVAGRLDLAVLYDNRPVPSPLDEPLMKTALFLIGPVGDAVTTRTSIRLRELESLPLTLPALPNRMRRLIDQVCREEKVRLDVRTTTDAIITLKDVVASGRSYSILPPHFVAADLAAGRLQAARIVEPEIERRMLLATTERGPLGRAAAELAALIRIVMEELIATGVLEGESCRPLAALVESGAIPGR